ncbi:MAG: hypothetical protein HY423_03240 [Candidatus Lambdaproteobacteria bacterium]|nr:hypothetical protein [Candidatus Lambdaproteobacteria bacterium]
MAAITDARPRWREIGLRPGIVRDRADFVIGSGAVDPGDLTPEIGFADGG